MVHGSPAAWRVNPAADSATRSNHCSTSSAESAAGGLLSEIESEVGQLRKQRRNLSGQAHEQRQIIVAHVQAASRLNAHDFIKQLLSQSSSAHAQRFMRYHGYFSQQRLAAIEQYKVSMAKLAETSKALDKQQEAQKCKVGR